MQQQTGRLQGLLEFLACEPYFDSKVWNALIQPYNEHGSERLTRLCSLLRGVMLRRTKEDVGARRRPLPFPIPAALHLTDQQQKPSPLRLFVVPILTMLHPRNYIWCPVLVLLAQDVPMFESMVRRPVGLHLRHVMSKLLSVRHCYNPQP